MLVKMEYRAIISAAGLQRGERCGGSEDKAGDLIVCYGQLPLHDEIE